MSDEYDHLLPWIKQNDVATESLEKRVDDLEIQMETIIQKQAETSTQLAFIERHMRSYNIRINGLTQENAYEDTRLEIAKMVHKYRLLPGYTNIREIANEIEHAYRIGPSSDRGRPIVATFYARPVRNTIMGTSKKPYNVNIMKPVYFTDDLSKPDLKKKRDCGQLIQRVWEKGSYAKFWDGKLFIRNKELADEDIRAAERSTILDGLIEEAEDIGEGERPTKSHHYERVDQPSGRNVDNKYPRARMDATTDRPTHSYRKPCPIEEYQADNGNGREIRDYGDRDTPYKTKLRKSQQSAKMRKPSDRYPDETKRAEQLATESPLLTHNYKTRAGIREWLQKPKEVKRKEWLETTTTRNTPNLKEPDYTDQMYYADQDFKKNEYLSTWYPAQNQECNQGEDDDDYWG